jgi:transcriptional regulator with XRE-family HTH domain
MVVATVIEQARRAAGLSQQALAYWARTSQSSVSEYESRRKSPTLEVIERLLDAADAVLTQRPKVFFELVGDSEAGGYWVPDRLWSIPVPKCFTRVHALRTVFPPAAVVDWNEDVRTWDLSIESERFDYYQLMLRAGLCTMIEDSIDGVLLIQAWPHLDLPQEIREAWQPLIDAATTTQPGPPLDPAGFSGWMAHETGVPWPPKRRRRRTQP